MTFQALLYTVLFLFNNYYVVLVVYFAFGCSASIWLIGYLFCVELIPENSKTTAGSIINIIDCTTYLLVVMYFWLISKHWVGILLVGYIVQILGAVFAWCLPESPPYLLSLNRYKEVAQVFAQIARINRKDDFNITENDIRRKNEAVVLEKAAPSTLYFLKQPNILLNLGLMMVNWITVIFDYFLIMFLVNSFNSSYICGMASSISELIAYGTSGYFYDKFGAKISLSRCFTVSVIAGIIILTYGLEH
jgi:hypothetical protein